MLVSNSNATDQACTWRNTESLAKLQQDVGSCDVFKHTLISSNFQKSQFKLAFP